jgi:hypothetical protein
MKSWFTILAFVGLLGTVTFQQYQIHRLNHAMQIQVRIDVELGCELDC